MAKNGEPTTAGAADEPSPRGQEAEPDPTPPVEEPFTNSLDEFEAALAGQDQQNYVLRLYVTGSTPRSRRAIENLRRICDEHLKGRCRLDVVDIYQQPELASRARIVAAPTLVKQLPPPLRRFIGDLSDEERILAGLEIRPSEEQEEHHDG